MKKSAVVGLVAFGTALGGILGGAAVTLAQPSFEFKQVGVILKQKITVSAPDQLAWVAKFQDGPTTCYLFTLVDGGGYDPASTKFSCVK